MKHATQMSTYKHKTRNITTELAYYSMSSTQWYSCKLALVGSTR
jgi:hypothetical protein